MISICIKLYSLVETSHLRLILFHQDLCISTKSALSCNVKKKPGSVSFLQNQKLTGLILG